MSSEQERLLVATHNEGKVTEYRELLAGINVRLVKLSDVGIRWDVEETGNSFLENAVLKATVYARASKLLTLADDSGLEVDALNGEPGVRTARFGGNGLSSVQRYRLLLQKLEAIPWPNRSARFCCVVALADSDDVITTASGTIEGRIALEPSGTAGFGYDPIFYVPEAGVTMAELPAAVKNRISHRARALAALRDRLEQVLAR